jgi:hypothetical protein
MIKKFGEFINESKKSKMVKCEIDLNTENISLEEAKEVFDSNDVEIVEETDGAVSDSVILVLKGKREDIHASLEDIDFDPDEADWQ